jgi:hypothetical protein
MTAVLFLIQIECVSYSNAVRSKCSWATWRGNSNSSDNAFDGDGAQFLVMDFISVISSKSTIYANIIWGVIFGNDYVQSDSPGQCPEFIIIKRPLNYDYKETSQRCVFAKLIRCLVVGLAPFLQLAAISFVILAETLANIESRVGLCLQAGGNLFSYLPQLSFLCIYESVYLPSFVFIGKLLYDSWLLIKANIPVLYRSKSL